MKARRRGLTRVVACCAALLAFARGHAQPTYESLGLPEVLAGEARTIATGTPMEKMSRTYFEIAPTWSWSRLEFEEGSLGWLPEQVRHTNESRTLLYQPKNRRAEIHDTLSWRGYDAGEPMLSPGCWVRFLRIQAAAGDTPAMKFADGREVWRCRVHRDESVYSIIIDPESRTIERVEIDHPRTDPVDTVWTYLNWESLGPGLHHPTEIRGVLHDRSGKVLEIRRQITDLRPLPSNSGLRSFELPPDVTIVDNIEGVVRDAKFEVIGTFDPAQPGAAGGAAPTAPPRRWIRVLLVILALSLLAAAAIAYRMRRAG